MEFNGTIHKIFDAVQISATFKKREVVLEVINTGSNGTDYPEYISFQFVQDKCDLLNDKKEGDAVQVLFNLKGRKWVSPQGETKYFNTLDAWQIHMDKEAPAAAPQVPVAAALPQQAVPEPPVMGTVDDDDLEVPF